MTVFLFNGIVKDRTLRFVSVEICLFFFIYDVVG